MLDDTICIAFIRYTVPRCIVCQTYRGSACLIAHFTIEAATSRPEGFSVAHAVLFAQELIALRGNSWVALGAAAGSPNMSANMYANQGNGHHIGGAPPGLGYVKLVPTPPLAVILSSMEFGDGIKESYRWNLGCLQRVCAESDATPQPKTDMLR